MIIKEQKKSALDDYNKNREKTKSLKDIIDKLSKLKMPNEIFIEWKNKIINLKINYVIFEPYFLIMYLKIIKLKNYKYIFKNPNS